MQICAWSSPLLKFRGVPGTSFRGPRTLKFWLDSVTCITADAVVPYPELVSVTEDWRGGGSQLCQSHRPHSLLWFSKPFWFVVLAESRIGSLSRLSTTVSHHGLDLSILPGSQSLPHFVHSFLSVLAPCVPCDLTNVLVQIKAEYQSTDPNMCVRFSPTPRHTRG
jgi:hypothetical protein